MEVQCLADYKIRKGTGEYWRAIIALFFGSLVTFGAEYCVQPIIPVFTETFSLEPAIASLAVSFVTGGMAIAMLFIAEFAKRLPRKGVIHLCICFPIIWGQVSLARGAAISLPFWAGRG